MFQEVLRVFSDAVESKLLFKDKDETLFWRSWQSLLDATKAGPRYSSQSLKMWVLIAGDQGLLHADKSFIYLRGGAPVAGVFFPLLKVGGEIIVSVPGDSVYAPLIADLTIEKDLFAVLDKLAREQNVAKIELQIDPLDRQTNYNYLQKYGYLEKSLLSYVLDLTVSDYLASCRKGHRSEIKQILADADVEIFHTDRDRLDRTAHEQYRELHHKLAGKVTRPKETFDLQYQRLSAGEAVLFGIKYRGRVAALTYFDFLGDKANYASSAHDPDLPPLAFGHALVYSAAQYLKAKGIKLIDTEQPGSPSGQFGYYPSLKQLNIAFFKRGFGGRYVQNYRGVKYLSKERLSKDIKEFSAKYEISTHEK